MLKGQVKERLRTDSMNLAMWRSSVGSKSLIRVDSRDTGGKELDSRN